MEDFYDDSSPYLDYNKDIRIKKNHLTLWDQPGKIQSVTFRLNDSIPAKERKLLNGLKETFEKLNPRPWKREIQLNYYKLIGKRQEMLLDQGYGSCIFKNPNFRKILDETILFYNEKRYILLSYVIMPNHVHMLLIMNDGYYIEKTIGNIKKYSARKINHLQFTKGEMWVKENYCRLIRSEEHYKVVRAYIRENPKYLSPGEFTYRDF